MQLPLFFYPREDNLKRVKSIFIIANFMSDTKAI